MTENFLSCCYCDHYVQAGWNIKSILVPANNLPVSWVGDPTAKPNPQQQIRDKLAMNVNQPKLSFRLRRIFTFYFFPRSVLFPPFIKSMFACARKWISFLESFFSINNLLEVRDVLKVMLRSLTKDKKKTAFFCSTVLQVCCYVWLHNWCSCKWFSLLRVPSKAPQDDLPRRHRDDLPKTEFSPKINQTFGRGGVLCNNRREAQSEWNKKKNSFQVLFCLCLRHFSGRIYHLCSYENNEAVWIVALLVCKEHKEDTKWHSYKSETGGNPDDKAFQSSSVLWGMSRIIFLE